MDYDLRLNQLREEWRKAQTNEERGIIEKRAKLLKMAMKRAEAIKTVEEIFGAKAI